MYEFELKFLSFNSNFYWFFQKRQKNFEKKKKFELKNLSLKWNSKLTHYFVFYTITPLLSATVSLLFVFLFSFFPLCVSLSPLLTKTHKQKHNKNIQTKRVIFFYFFIFEMKLFYPYIQLIVFFPVALHLSLRGSFYLFLLI